MNLKSKIFKNKKIISLDKFIYSSLYDTQYGFYMKKNPFGKKGDFITSPNISILFSEMIAIWCISFWEKLGSPKKINIIELGPGDGTLAESLVKTFKNFNKFNRSYRLTLLEKSKYLIKLQKEKINSKNVKWIKNLNKIDNLPTIVIANEFFDALPIKQFIYEKNQWYEKYVKLLKNNNIKLFNKKIKLPNFKKICNIDIKKNQNFIEFSISSYNYVKKISDIIKKNNGGLIFFDYGYNHKKMFNTLQSVNRHNFSNLLINPGDNDITYLINFKILTDIINKLDLESSNVVNQEYFLKKMGILERANNLSKNKTFKEKADIFYRLKRLIDHNEMGTQFKVISAQKKGIKFNLGFN